MQKKAYFFIDDTIWTFRDLARQKPASLFDLPFMKMLKNAHENHSAKIQLNLFYRTDFYYGGDEFNLSEVPDTYRHEWEANKDWLKLGFHAKQEFPDYPYVNGNYEDVKKDCTLIKNEIIRFAGEGSIAHTVTPHWLPISKEGCQALVDCGFKYTSFSCGASHEYTGDPDVLPYGHAGRLLQNKKPETRLFTRKSLDTAIERSICAYNHFEEGEVEDIIDRLVSYYDENTGMTFANFWSGPVLNLSKLETLEEEFSAYVDNEYLGYATHEQYFYPEYFAYQPDYDKKLYFAAKYLTENGFEFIFPAEDLMENNN